MNDLLCSDSGWLRVLAGMVIGLTVVVIRMMVGWALERTGIIQRRFVSHDGGRTWTLDGKRLRASELTDALQDTVTFDRGCFACKGKGRALAGLGRCPVCRGKGKMKVRSSRFSMMFYTLVIVCLTGCTSDDRTVKTLEAAGFTDIHTNGYSFFGCKQDDDYATAFRAKNPQGKVVEGAVCCSLVGSCTVRF